MGWVRDNQKLRIDLFGVIRKDKGYKDWRNPHKDEWHIIEMKYKVKNSSFLIEWVTNYAFLVNPNWVPLSLWTVATNSTVTVSCVREFCDERPRLSTTSSQTDSASLSHPNSLFHFTTYLLPKYLKLARFITQIAFNCFFHRVDPFPPTSCTRHTPQAKTLDHSFPNFHSSISTLTRSFIHRQRKVCGLIIIWPND